MRGGIEGVGGVSLFYSPLGNWYPLLVLIDPDGENSILTTLLSKIENEKIICQISGISKKNCDQNGEEGA